MTEAMDYDQLRSRAAGILRDLGAAIDGKGPATLARELDGLAQKVAAEYFNLVILGQYKRGKSTFINALLGRELLPTAVVPLTSVPTILRHGTEKARVHYLDKRVEEVPAEAISEFVTERANPRNEKGVSYLELFVPAQFLAQGVRLIDTPGVGSVYAHNTEAAYEFLPQVDAAIFLLAADPPVTPSEAEYLRDISKHAVEIVYVLNKADLLSPAEADEVIAFAREAFADVSGVQINDVHQVSAKRALCAKLLDDVAMLQESGFPALETYLTSALVRRKGDVLLRAVLRKIQRLAATAQMSIQLEIKAASLPQEELDRKLDVMYKKLGEIDAYIADRAILFKGYRDKIIEQATVDVNELKARQLPLLEEQVRAFVASSDLAPRELARTGADLVRDSIVNVFDSWRPEAERRLDEGIRSITARFAADSNRLLTELRELCGQLFGITDAVPLDEASLTSDSDFYYRFDDPPGLLPFDVLSLSPMLPRGVARRMVERDLLAKAGELFDRQCGRTRYDFAQRTERSLDGFRRLLEERESSLTQAINGAIEKGKAMRTEVQGETRLALTNLEQRLAAVEKIRQEAEALSRKCCLGQAQHSQGELHDEGDPGFR